MNRNTALAIAMVSLVLVAGGTALGLGTSHSSTGTELHGGIRAVLQARPAPGPADAPQVRKGLQLARDVIAARASDLGYLVARVDVQGPNLIVVQLPPITGTAGVLNTLRNPGYVEWLDAGDSPVPAGALVTTNAGGPFPDQLQVAQQRTSYQSGRVYPVVLSSADVDGSRVHTQINAQNGSPTVAFSLRGPGAATLRAFTASHFGKYMPIVLDKLVIASPVIQSEITDGTGQLDYLTAAGAQRLAVQLHTGPLPFGFTVIETSPIP